MLQQVETTVKLSNDHIAEIDEYHGTVQVRQYGRLVAALDLADAITLAKAVMAYDEHLGSQLDAIDPDAYYDHLRGS